jgi:hypothetical protein
VVTVTTWPAMTDGTAAADGDHVIIRDVVGMTQINDREYTLSNCNVGAKTFELHNVNSGADYNTTAFTAWASGGTAQLVENTWVNVGHLEGKAVELLVDGGFDDDIVDTGVVRVARYYNRALIGLPYWTTIEPTPIEFALDTGPTTNLTKRVTSVILSVYQSGAFKCGVDTNHLHSVDIEELYGVNLATLYVGNVAMLKRLTLQAAGELVGATPLFTGERSIGVGSTFGRSLDLLIVQDLPLPLTVRGIMPDIGLYGAG